MTSKLVKRHREKQRLTYVMSMRILMTEHCAERILKRQILIKRIGSCGET